MKIQKLFEWSEEQQKAILQAQDEAEAEFERDNRQTRSSDIVKEIQKKLKDKSYKNRDELKNDVVALFKKWQENK